MEFWFVLGDVWSGMRNFFIFILKYVILMVYFGNVVKLVCVLWCEYGVIGCFYYCGWFEIGDDGLFSYFFVRDLCCGLCKGCNWWLRI